ncbi:MAG: hypothetical protein E6J88_16015 [Deltaproteobacteria bacterium]|nr:MAG: hypothetical protein E6J88_16015 [Deltaproteobacteria bacterium]
MSFVGTLVRNLLGKPVAADFRDSAEHFVAVLRESGIELSWNKDELRYIDALVERLGGHNEYRDAIGCYLGELVARNFPGAEWVPGHALGPAVRVNGRHVFPLGWVYRRADGGPAETIARKLHKELGFPEDPEKLGAFTDSGARA